MPDARSPASTPSRIRATRTATSAMARNPMRVSASSCSDAPVVTKNTTSTGRAPRWIATFSASPCGIATFWITMPAAMAAISGSNPWVTPTWLSSAHTPSSTSVTSRAT